MTLGLRLITATLLLKAALVARGAEVCADDSYMSGSDGGHLSAAWQTYKTGEQGFTYYEETADKQTHLSCFVLQEGENSSELQQKITVEFKGHKIGIATRNVNGVYPLNTVEGIDEHKTHMVAVLGETKAAEEVESMKSKLQRIGRLQDSFNSFHSKLMAVNGVELGESDDDTTTLILPNKTGKGFCSLPDGEHGFFGDTARIDIKSGTSNDLVSMVSYMFRNAAAKEASKGEVTYTMDLGDLKCATETILGIKPATGGGVSVKFEVRAGGFVDENGLNDRMTFHILSDQVQILLPKQRMLLAVGLVPEGSENETHMVLSVATQFVCDATKELVNGTIESDGSTSFIMTLSPSVAPESCGTMYWDPVQNPGPCPQDGEYACAKSFGRSAAAASTASTATGLSAYVGLTVCVCMFLDAIFSG
eukprot:TRINITY_DN19395_c0_g1_i1.p1 TRINITY_DN19395_c0_g1~~TRINITY_DN19395_c0_g1_i1.p1  ORF type:complete len:421 (-),score=72.01 TRINITY_DN19395_c0_g1_i1:68-1330(-)